MKTNLVKDLILSSVVPVTLTGTVIGWKTVWKPELVFADKSHAILTAQREFKKG